MPVNRDIVQFVLLIFTGNGNYFAAIQVVCYSDYRI